ncbi:FkbM family methyltransferase [Haloplanus aerogenes]|nr:FkbM family methyltransferase [Haloplanus aerogenes]
MERLGLQQHVTGLYDRLDRATQPDTYTKEFQGVEATFHTATRLQYRRATSIKTELMSSLFDEIRPDDVFYDIGANVGSVSCLVGQTLSTGEIISFEPLPVNADALRANLELNDISGMVLEYALSDENGEIEFRVPVDEVEAGSSNAIAPENEASRFWEERQERVMVKTRRGDELIEEDDLPIPNVVKFDIEGAELKAIQGLKETLSHPECRTVICEVHAYLLEDFGGSANELEAELQECGFELERFDERKYEKRGESVHLYRLKATK